MNQALAELKKKILNIEKQIQNQEIRIQKKIAAFDLDNTLIIGDIGEAVFSRLKKEETRNCLPVDHRPIPLTWSEYQDLMNANKKREAYERLVTAMDGLPLETLRKITEKTIGSRSRTIRIQGKSVPVPRINKTMLALIRMLEKRAYHICIISASNHHSVQLVAEKLLRIPSRYAFGIRSRIRYQNRPKNRGKIPILTKKLESPVPFAEGKAGVYAKYLGSIAPLVTAGDSESDIFLLDLTHEKGLSIWLGKDRVQYESVKQKMKNPSTLFFLPQK